MVLVVVLVVITLLTLCALTFSELMTAEREGAEVAVRQVQARALADSGVELARLFLAQDVQTQTQSGGWYHNSQFRGVAVLDDGGAQGIGRFTMVAPRVEDGRYMGIRFGLEDESARLNLNVLAAIDRTSPGSGRQILMGLPGMTEDVADAILDWMDPDDELREFGAEIETYASLSPPYATRNGPLATIEELLLVRGVTPSLLLGVDANRNWLADNSEASSMMFIEADNSDGSMSFGWSAYLTLYSAEANLQPDGQPRINLNGQDLKKLHQDLDTAVGTEWANFIVAYRQDGPFKETATGSTAVSAASVQLDLERPGKTNLSTVLDLIGTKVRTRVTGSDNPVVLESPFPDTPGLMNAYLPKLMDYCTASPLTSIPGRININLASRTVLAGIPEMPEEAVDMILSQRPEDPTQAEEMYRHETWILGNGLVTLEQMKKLMPYVCGGGSVFRAQVVGYFDRGGPAARIEAVIDASSQPGRIVFWRDMTHLGRGYPLETLGVEAIPY